MSAVSSSLPKTDISSGIYGDTLNAKDGATETLHLIDSIGNAQRRCPNADYIQVQSVTIHRCSKMGIFQHPDSELQFSPLHVGAEPRLLFSIAIKSGVWERMGAPVCFQIHALLEDGSETELYRRELFPREVSTHRAWHDVELPLYRRADAHIELRFKTSVAPTAESSYCWAVWGEPRIVSRKDTPRLRYSRPHKGHIVLITADALRADMLGCYGNAEVQTPYLDALCQEAVRFSHARSQSSTTPGSYTSLFTSLYANRHGVCAEWGRVPQQALSLPKFLAGLGYHSAMFSSEAELSEPKLGLASHFGEAIPAVGTPMQRGEVTTRSFLRELPRYSRPTFMWLQYFDVHPPSAPPEPFASMYYEGDPTSESNRFQSELIARIRGVESIAEISRNFESLRDGYIDHAVIVRLDALVHSLRGRNWAPPDIAVHMMHLGPEARRGMELPEFADWLASQVESLRAGVVSAELYQWLLEINHYLQPIEQEILNWLEGVVDFRYPLAQYKGSVSYFDHQVGLVLDALREAELYDDACVIVTSPHGEVFNENGEQFHHHFPTESVARVPLLIKFPRASGMPRGHCIDGVMDLIDVFPTLAESLSLPVPKECQGVSRYRHIHQLERIPRHESFLCDAYEQTSAVSDECYKLIRANSDIHISEELSLRAGEFLAMSIADHIERPLSAEEAGAPEVCELVAKLDRWSEEASLLPVEEDVAFFHSLLRGAQALPDELEVSFIVANYNRCELLQDCLSSITQTVKDVSYEVLVVDDCSSDGSAEFVAALTAPFRGICNSERQGFARNNNRAAALARGRVLCFLNNDLLLTPGWLKPMLDGLEKLPRAGMIGNLQRRPQTQEIDHIGVQFSDRGEPSNYGREMRRLPLRSYTEWPAVTAACCLMRKELFFAFGGFDEGFRNGFEDVDLCMRISESGHRLYTANKSLIFHHVHGSHGRFDHELENYRRFANRWRDRAKLRAKMRPPEEYLASCELVRSWRGLATPSRYLAALYAVLRFEVKRRLYASFIQRPRRYPSGLRRRLAAV